MRKDGRRSANIEDRRGRGGAGVKIGLGATVVIVVIAALLGQDPAKVLQQLDGGGAPSGAPTPSAPVDPAQDELADFVSVVLADTEDTWTPLFAAQGQHYKLPTLVLFRDQTASACGQGQAAMGPFYCPADAKIYIDLSFYRDLRERFKAPGDFAQAYVIAHEVGHHVQTLLGTSTRVRQQQRGMAKAQANALSVRMELQADCYAGLWAHHADKARQILDEGDVEEGLAAASAIGDDRLQKQSAGRVVPESFTHGTSAQRARWFRVGLTQGTLAACDTFAATTL